MNQSKLLLLAPLVDRDFFITFQRTTQAGSATWNLNPTNGDWNTAANWMPATVPNGLSDIATFEASNTTNISLSSSVTLNGITFEAGASMFTITSPSSFAGFLINGVGVTNNSGVEQTFVADARGRDQGDITFAGSPRPAMRLMSTTARRPGAHSAAALLSSILRPLPVPSSSPRWWPC